MHKQKSPCRARNIRPCYSGRSLSAGKSGRLEKHSSSLSVVTVPRQYPLNQRRRTWQEDDYEGEHEVHHEQKVQQEAGNKDDSQGDDEDGQASSKGRTKGDSKGSTKGDSKGGNQYRYQQDDNSILCGCQ